MIILRTGHEISDTVTSALEEGLYGPITCRDFSIGYGILRGNAEKFRKCPTWINIDRGYIKPHHYDGYYRFSLCGTQQTNLGDIEPDYVRLEKLQVDFPLPRGIDSTAHTLIIPPTDHVAKFFKVNAYEWVRDQRMIYTDSPLRIRMKGDDTPLEKHLANCLRVVTFNSSVGWEALRRGIPVYSDETHSIVGAYKKFIDKPLHLDFKARRDLFAIMAGLQLTLQEIRDGMLCPLIDKLLAL